MRRARVKFYSIVALCFICSWCGGWILCSSADMSLQSLAYLSASQHVPLAPITNFFVGFLTTPYGSHTGVLLTVVCFAYFIWFIWGATMEPSLNILRERFTLSFLLFLSIMFAYCAICLVAGNFGSGGIAIPGGFDPAVPMCEPFFITILWLVYFGMQAALLATIIRLILRTKKGLPNKASHATSEPAPGADSSAHEG